jgi:hypothetical protein
MTTATTGRTIDAAAYGFVPAAGVNDDFAGPNPDRVELLGFVRAGNWRAIETLMASMDRVSERRFEALNALGSAALVEDAWLDAWLAGAPGSVDAICAQMNSMVKVAWEIRSSKQPQHVAPDQWQGFFRVLRQVPTFADRASTLAPDDPAPYLEMLIAARGLQWTPDKFRDLWQQVHQRAPQSALAAVRAMTYWRPRWAGSMELMTAFVDEMEASADPGMLMSQLRLDLLYTESRPADRAGATAFDRSAEVAAAIDAALADLAAADPADVRVPYLRHWLALWLYLAGRDYEAIQQFRAIGGFSGAMPWQLWTKAKAEFTSTRATCVVRWEDAGRPTP